MGFRINGSVIIAALILAGVGGYMYTGEIIKGGQVDPTVPTIAERNEAKSAEAFRVRTVAIQSKSRQNILPIRGRTKAETIVPIRAETGGTLTKRLVAKGEIVTAGTLVCELDKGTRLSRVNQAQAALDQAMFDQEATEKLIEQGFATKSRLQGLLAASNRAKSELEQAQQELERTSIVATVGGIVQDPVAEVGDNLKGGDPCITLVDLDPMLLTAQVGEQDILNVQVGLQAGIRLITGQEFAGQVRYVASSADPKTRTFTVEVQLPNPDGKILDGVTADGGIRLTSESAYLVNASWIVLSDEGQVGVRIVDGDSKVAFKKIDILQQAAEGVWVSGLENGDQIISLGQDFVVIGETVEAVPQSFDTAELNAGK